MLFLYSLKQSLARLFNLHERIRRLHMTWSNPLSSSRSFKYRCKPLQHIQTSLKATHQPSACLIVTSVLTTSLAPAYAQPPINCAAELDSAVTMASNTDYDKHALQARFVNLESVCPDFAQLAHNQGVLAATDNQWPQAIAHFERALKKDKRAADTHRHLKQIFEYRAAQAYARALDTPLKALPPELTLQDSGKHNAEVFQNQTPFNELRDIATIEYELFAWWQAHQNWTGIRAHYVDNYNIEAIKLARQDHLSRQWPDTRREIAFTANDAVIVLSDSTQAHTLLLMRLVGTRWKIYQETRL